MNEITINPEPEHLNDQIVQAMVENQGNLAKVSRLPEIGLNAIKLRQYVKDNPIIRDRYQKALTEALSESGVHIAERLLKFLALQDAAFGDTELGVPADPKMAIEISKHISELIRESRGINLNPTSIAVITSKEGAADILKEFMAQ